MFLIIVIIVIFLVWRSKKKKAQASARGAQPAVSPTDAMPVRQLRGRPVSEADLPKKLDELVSGSEWGDQPKVGYNPDYCFACTKKIFEKASTDVDNIPTTASKGQGYRVIMYGSRLAEHYRDGYGCDPDPQAAINVMNTVFQFWERESAFIRGRRFSQQEHEIVMEMDHAILDGKLCQADCLAILGKERAAGNAYRACFDAAPDYGNPDYVRECIIEHAMGDYSVNYPRPMCFAVATEFALNLAGNGKAMGGHFLKALLEIRNLDLASLGQSWEQDLAVYSKGDGAYTAYKVGKAKLYGLGTQPDVQEALELLQAGYEAKGVHAAHMLYEYYNHLEDAARGGNKTAYKAAQAQATDWSHRYERLKVNPEALVQIMSTGALNDDMRKYADKYSAPVGYEPTIVPATPAAPQRSSGGSDFSMDTPVDAGFDLRLIPSIVYDDRGRTWKKRGLFGDHAVYYNDDVGEVTIYSAAISGTSAATDAGYLHWY